MPNHSILADLDTQRTYVRDHLPATLIFHDVYRLISARMLETIARFEDPSAMVAFARRFADLYVNNVRAHADKRPVAWHWQRHFRIRANSALSQLWSGARTHIVYDYQACLASARHPSPEDLREMERMQRELIPEIVQLLQSRGSKVALLGLHIPILATVGYLPVKYWRAGALRQARKQWDQSVVGNAAS